MYLLKCKPIYKMLKIVTVSKRNTEAKATKLTRYSNNDYYYLHLGRYVGIILYVTVTCHFLLGAH